MNSFEPIGLAPKPNLFAFLLIDAVEWVSNSIDDIFLKKHIILILFQATEHDIVDGCQLVRQLCLWEIEIHVV